MSAGDGLRKMAAYIEATGFDASYRSDVDSWCGCFVHALHKIGGWDDLAVWQTLANIVGGFDEGLLRKHGWTGLEATNDAVAACLIAADIADAEAA